MMHVLRKGEAFPQVRRRSRRSSLTGPRVIWTSPGLAPAQDAPKGRPYIMIQRILSL
jgi:hypothetical protein